jgi:DNA-binding transcriptional MerR regulator
LFFNVFPRHPRNFPEVLEFLEICLVLSAIALFSKGVLNMTLLPIADGARLLGIHPKTLHHWLKEANMPVVTHSRDARIKCVTQEHLHQVANLHGRPLQSSLPLDAASPLAPSQGQALSVPENEREPASTICSLPTFHVAEADQAQRLACLETKVVTLQEQITQLTLVLLKERERSVEHRLTALESLMQQLTGEQMPDPPVLEAEQKPVYAPPGTRPLHPAEQLARSRRPALIEYCASGIYVIISSQEGEVHLEPHSRAWFDWLATLSSFRFIGPVGRFTAHRGYKQGQQTHFWSASRCVRRHTYKHYLGVTESLTLASLEHVAARLQSDIDAR